MPARAIRSARARSAAVSVSPSAYARDSSAWTSVPSAELEPPSSRATVTGVDDAAPTSVRPRKQPFAPCRQAARVAKSCSTRRTGAGAALQRTGSCPGGRIERKTCDATGPVQRTSGRSWPRRRQAAGSRAGSGRGTLSREPAARWHRARHRVQAIPRPGHGHVEQPLALFRLARFGVSIRLALVVADAHHRLLPSSSSPLRRRTRMGSRPPPLPRPMLTMNTTGNSRPLAAWTVIRLTASTASIMAFDSSPPATSCEKCSTSRSSVA